jgi:hypothetical protein
MGLGQARAQAPTYFLVGEQKPLALAPYAKHDCYVLPLYRQQDIDHARFLISKYHLGVVAVSNNPVVVAWAIRGKDGINRNFLDPRFQEWSWHVEFVAFTEGTPETWDGWPTYTESVFEDSPYVHEKTKIGYWDYTVIRELGPVPLALSIIPDGQRLQFYWSGLGRNYLYTLESKTSLTGANWSAPANVIGPRHTNHWTLPRPARGTGFYRVKAEQPKL